MTFTKVNIGDEVEEVVTGLKGIAVGRHVYLNGCVRLTIQPREAKDGKMADGYTVDEPQLKVIARGVLPVIPEPIYDVPAQPRERVYAGGPREDAPRRPDPTR